MRFDQFALIQIISSPFGFGVAIVFAWLGYGYWALVWKELGRTLVNAILAWSFCSWRPGLPVRNSGVRSLLTFGYNVTGYNMLYYLTNNLDTILIGKFAGAVPVGLYSRAKQLTTIPVSQLLEPVRYVSLPAMGALQRDPVRFRNYFEKMLAVLSFLYMPLIVYLGIYSKPVVLMTLGSQWLGAVPIFRLLAVAMFARPIVVMLGMILLSTGRTKRYFFWGVFTSLSLVLSFVGGIKWGTVGVAASWSVAMAVSLSISLVFVYGTSSVSLGSIFSIIYRPATASMVMGVVLGMTYEYLAVNDLTSQLAMSILLGSGAYLVTWAVLPGGYGKIMEFASYPLNVLKRKNAFSSN